MLHEALALAEAGGDREVACKVVPRARLRGGAGRSRRVWRGGGCPGPARWRRTTGSAPPCSGCAGRRCPTGRTTRRRSTLLDGVRRGRAALRGRSARRHGRWRSSAARCCCAASCRRPSSVLDDSLALVGKRAGWRSSPSPRRCGPRWRCARATSIARSRCSTTPLRSAAASATRAGRRWPRARGAWSTRRRASAPRRWPGCATRRCARARGRSLRLDARLVPGRARRSRDRRRCARCRGLRGPARAARRPRRHARARSARRAAPREARRSQRRRVRPPAGRGHRQPRAARRAGRRAPDHTRRHTAGWWISRHGRRTRHRRQNCRSSTPARSWTASAWRRRSRTCTAAWPARRTRELHFEVGRAVAEHLGYPAGLLDAIPAEALASFAGVGYHLDLAALAARRGRARPRLGLRHGRLLRRGAGRPVGPGRRGRHHRRAAREGRAAARPRRLLAGRARGGPHRGPPVRGRELRRGHLERRHQPVAGQGPGLRRGRARAPARRQAGDHRHRQRPGAEGAHRRNVDLWAACIAGAIPRDQLPRGDRGPRVCA